jgi:hypothetical protein
VKVEDIDEAAVSKCIETARQMAVRAVNQTMVYIDYEINRMNGEINNRQGKHFIFIRVYSRLIMKANFF